VADDRTALDETRLLILGAQILFGFHLNAAFQAGFSRLSDGTHLLYAGDLLLNHRRCGIVDHAVDAAPAGGARAINRASSGLAPGSRDFRSC
jgi:uncharacterized protein DUF6328